MQFGPTLNTTRIVFLLTRNYSQVIVKWIFDLNDAICEVETKQFLDSSGKCLRSNCLLQKFLLPCFDLKFSPMPHGNNKQHRTRESLKLRPSLLFPTTPCIIVGHSRVVVIVVVINAPYPSLYNPQRRYQRKFETTNTNHRNGGCV